MQHTPIKLSGNGLLSSKALRNRSQNFWGAASYKPVRSDVVRHVGQHWARMRRQEAAAEEEQQWTAADYVGYKLERAKGAYPPAHWPYIERCTQ